MAPNSEILSPTTSLSPWQLIYRGAHALRVHWYSGRASSLPRPVISVGNLHWGGTGKTPVVAALAGHLRERPLRTSILSRGYRGKGRGVRLVSHGEGPLLGPMVAGDEPVLLAGELRGVSVVVGTDRFDAGRHALERLEPPPQIFVLDDGFSHLKLSRDLDLLTLPAMDPFGGSRLPPGGRLREPLTATRRAHALLLTGAEPGEGEAVAESLRQFEFDGPGFSCQIRPGVPKMDAGGELASGSKVLLVAAIARPNRFVELAGSLGFQVLGKEVFPDHHRYTGSSLKRIESAFRASGADAVLTTSKDRVKLSGRLEAALAELPIRAEPEPAFWPWFDSRVDTLIAKHDKDKPGRL